MKTPGITVRPLLLMSETHDLNEVFFENVKVPAENLVYQEGDGWTVAKFLLGYERLNTGEIGASKRDLARLKELAASRYKNGKPLSEDPRFQDKVSRVEVELMALEVTNLRFLDQIQRGRELGAEVSLLKVRGTEIQQALTELMLDVAGPFAAPAYPTQDMDFDTNTANLAQRYCNYRKASIYAGSNEIQRNIIAKMSLGL
jgi:alkylation response protein AidB-like acyl-CoA dehydrogenase